MQAQRHQEGVDHGDEDREDDRGVRVQPEQGRAQAGTDPDTQRTDEEGGHRHHDDEGQEGHEDHLHVGRNDLDQPLVDQCQDGDHHEGDEDLAAVAVELHGQPGNVRRAQLGVDRGVVDAGRARVLLQVDELRGQQRSHDRGADPRVDLELLGGVVGHHDGQEVEDGTEHGVDEQQRGRLFRRIRVGVDETEGLTDGLTRDDEGGAEQRRQQGAEGVREVLEEGVDVGVLAAGLGPGGGLDVGVGLARAGGAALVLHGRQAVDLVVHALHGTTDDDLVAVPGLGDGAHDARDGLDGRLVDAGGVLELEAQSGGAVGEMDDVLGAAHGVEDCLRG